MLDAAVAYIAQDSRPAAQRLLIQVLDSAPLAALLFKTPNLHIRDHSGTIHDAEPTGEA